MEQCTKSICSTDIGLFFASNDKIIVVDTDVTETAIVYDGSISNGSGDLTIKAVETILE